MDTETLVALICACVLVLFSNIDILRLILSPSRRSKSQAAASYADEDGEASESSSRSLADRLVHGSIAILSVGGLACASIIVALPRSSDFAVAALVWSQVASWGLSCLQSITLFTRPSVFQSYQLGQRACWTSLGLVVLAICDKPLLLWDKHAAIKSLQTAILVIAIARVFGCLQLPRRPDVYRNGRLVDRERTVSLWSRLTFGFVTPLVRHVGQERGTITVEQFPELPHRACSKPLHDGLQDTRLHCQSLLSALCRSHLTGLLLQLTLSVLYGALTFGPTVALYGILRSLENGSVDSPTFWVAALGITMFASSSVNSWLWWTTYSYLAIPVYSQLSAMLYSKSMLRKNVHSIASKSDEAKTNEDEPQQEVINLATVDIKRISDCLSYNHLIPSSLTQLFIGCALLVGLIGWPSLLAGLGANLLNIPCNLFIGTKFATVQQALMAARDERTTIVHEIVKNIRHVKFSSTETAWRDRVLDARRKELKLNFKATYLETGWQAVWNLSPLLLSVISLTVYAFIHGRLEPSVAFTAISIFGSLEVALTALPHLIFGIMEARTSVGRIAKYLGIDNKTNVPANEAGLIRFREATVSWPVAGDNDTGGFRLQELNLEFPSKKLCVITGRIGSGKSLLLASLLGEADIASGSVEIPLATGKPWKEPPKRTEEWIVHSSIAYVAQDPWIENGTICENILFGLPLDQTRYQKVLFASALERDLEILTDGDQTDTGANGINLSGGQRLRVSFARALYSRAGILLMDDIFSALDADTSRHIFEHGLTGELAKQRTRILATHHVGLVLPKTEYCVVLADGRVSCAGSAEEIVKTDQFAEFLTESDAGAKAVGQDRQKDNDEKDPANAERETQKFSPDEHRASGAVPLSLYKKFVFSDPSPWAWALGLCAALLFTFLLLARGWWLNIWTSSEDQEQGHILSFPNPQQVVIRNTRHIQTPYELPVYVGVYAAISLLAGLMGTMRFLFVRIATMRSSQALFQTLLSAVLAAPMRWVDTIPLGRVLNRFTSDIYTMDQPLGSDLADLLLWLLQIVGVLVASVSVSPLVLIPATILLALSIWLAATYLTAAREVKRLESVARTPILEHFTSSLVGLTTIRAYDRTDKYIRSMFDRIDTYSKMSWNLWLLNWWLQIRINLLGALFSTVVAALVVKLGISASLAGFAISFLLQYSFAVSSAVRFYANFEMDMNATERVVDYASIETEPQDGQDPPAAWPTRGEVIVKDLVVGYASDLPPALKGISFTIKSNERVGVVGRTGSGKSTLALALFRFLEPREGSVSIDGLDAAALRLPALRRALGLVPQQATLFTGTIRSNLDPFGWYSETELIDCLERVHLPTVSNGDGDTETAFSLSSPVANGGANFSQGQRQLLCLARAILQRPKIMILDEATSAVDMETDANVQQAIRAEFGRDMSSLLVIAHRLSTVADFDRILVLDEGRVVECGTPRELMEMDKGYFRDLVQQSGEKVALERTILGSRK